MATMKTRELIKLLENNGWILVGQKGSPMQFKHPDKVGKVTVASHGGNDDIPRGTLNSILRQAGLKWGDK